MRKWFGAQKLQNKFMLWYTAFAMLPIILITVYLYFYMERLMAESLDKNLDSQINNIERELDDKAGNYYTVSNLLYMDETLWSYLLADYSQRGYEDLYAYVDTLFSNIRMLYPEISAISVFSTNDTLPKDNYYFYVLKEEELEQKYPRLQQAGNVMQMSCREDGSICFTRFLNRYETGKYRNFLEICVARSVIEELLDSVDDTQTVSLIDGDGIVQISSQEKLLGQSYDGLALEHKVTRMCQTDYCGQLLLYTDLRTFHRPMRLVTFQILLVFALCCSVAFFAIVRYSRGFQQTVERVMNGAKAISYGDFSYRIPNAGTDEIGMIAESINKLGEQLEQTIEESYKKELNRQISELNQLQEQINPHFLYNALSSISSLALNNNDQETSQAIIYLADFYRISLNKGKQELAIREEIQLLESYMKIQRMRFGDEITLDYNLDESLLDHKVMKLTLQPIVENALHHGRMDDAEFHILIRLYRDGEKTVLEVIDDGRGIEPETMLKLQDSMDHAVGGYGLRNVNIRIKLQYGPEYGISIESEEGFGTKVRIELP